MKCPGLTQSDLDSTVAQDAWADVWGLDISPKYDTTPHHTTATVVLLRKLTLVVLWAVYAHT